MKMHGLNIDAQAIGQGMYDLITAKGEEALVAFGMIPSWVPETMEPMIREKVIELAAKQMDCSVEEFLPYVDEDKVKKIVRDVVHEVFVTRRLLQ